MLGFLTMRQALPRSKHWKHGCILEVGVMFFVLKHFGGLTPAFRVIFTFLSLFAQTSKK